jgi:hypothetical protein
MHAQRHTHSQGRWCRVTVRLAPDEYAWLADAAVPHKVLDANVQAALDQERARLAQRPARFDNTTVRVVHSYESVSVCVCFGCMADGVASP